jgi:hypothetical protein
VAVLCRLSTTRQLAGLLCRQTRRRAAVVNPGDAPSLFNDGERLQKSRLARVSTQTPY